MSSTNEENTTETEADTEGHGRKGYRIGEAGTEADTEGHLRTKASRVGEAGTEADTEGHGRGRTGHIGEAGAEDAAVADRPVAARSPEGWPSHRSEAGGGDGRPRLQRVVELLDGSIAGGQLT